MSSLSKASPLYIQTPAGTWRLRVAKFLLRNKSTEITIGMFQLIVCGSTGDDEIIWRKRLKRGKVAGIMHCTWVGAIASEEEEEGLFFASSKVALQSPRLLSHTLRPPISLGLPANFVWLKVKISVFMYE